VILASGIGSIISPFAKLFGWLLAAFFSFTHSYGLAIVLLTLTVMVIVFPLTRRGTRSMMRMQLLQPELLKIRNRYKSTPGQTAEEKQANRQKLNDEMMALYRENNVSPTGGCLPMFLQFPIFIVLYNVIRGMTRTATVGKGAAAHVVSRPEYISKKTALYNALLKSHGVLRSFGLNLADSVRSHQHAWVDVIPYVIVILIAVALQYVSIWQITNRNPAASQANAQMQAAQKFMPLIFVFFYIVLPAGVGVYFIVSSAFRIVQQEWMYKHDPMITATIEELRKRKASAPIETKAQPKGFRARLKALAEEAGGNTAPASALKADQARDGRSGGGRPAQGAAGAKAGQRRSGSGAAAGAASRPRPSGSSAASAASAASGASGSGSSGSSGSQPGRNGKSTARQQRPSSPGANAAAGRSAGNRSQSKRPRRPR